MHPNCNYIIKPPPSLYVSQLSTTFIRNTPRNKFQQISKPHPYIIRHAHIWHPHIRHPHIERRSCSSQPQVISNRPTVSICLDSSVFFFHFIARIRVSWKPDLGDSLHPILPFYISSFFQILNSKPQLQKGVQNQRLCLTVHSVF